MYLNKHRRLALSAENTLDQTGNLQVENDALTTLITKPTMNINSDKQHNNFTTHFHTPLIITTVNHRPKKAQSSFLSQLTVDGF